MMTSPTGVSGPHPSHCTQAGMCMGRIPGVSSKMFKETSQRLQAQALMPGVCYFLHPDFLWQDWNKGQPQTHLQEKPNQTKPNQTTVPLSCTSWIHLQLSFHLSCSVPLHPPLPHFLPLLLTQDETKAPLYHPITYSIIIGTTLVRSSSFSNHQLAG